MRRKIGLVLLLVALQASSMLSQSVRLVWDNPVPANVGQTGFNIYRSEQSSTYPARPVNSTVITIPRFEDTAVNYGVMYYYVVTAVGAGNQESAKSNQVEVAPERPAIPLPGLPTGLISTCTKDGTSATTTWTLPANATSSYVRASHAADDTVLLVYEDKTLVNTFTFSVPPGVPISWWVHGANASNATGPEGWAPGIGPYAMATLTCNAVPPPVPVRPPINLRITVVVEDADGVRAEHVVVIENATESKTVTVK